VMAGDQDTDGSLTLIRLTSVDTADQNVIEMLLRPGATSTRPT